jgi:2-methylisocitrate lyase-like PEP mutase family enzyme
LIEDSAGEVAQLLYALSATVKRLRAIRPAIDAKVGDRLRVDRSEGFNFRRPDLAETNWRLQAYAEAGAACLYAPGLRTKEEIRAVVEAVAPGPVYGLTGRPTEP